MSYYINTTQTPNSLFDHILKIISCSELKVLLIIIRKTIGQSHPTSKGKRLERAWISQRLFMICCNLSGRAVSSAIDSLVQKKLIEVSNNQGDILHAKAKRKGATRLYYASRLRLEQNKKQASELSCHYPVNKGHTIKLRTSKLSCYNSSQGIRKLSDTERYLQIQNNLISKINNDTH